MLHIGKLRRLHIVGRGRTPLKQGPLNATCANSMRDNEQVYGAVTQLA
jgi:hypothetical protein